MLRRKFELSLFKKTWRATDWIGPLRILFFGFFALIVGKIVFDRPSPEFRENLHAAVGYINMDPMEKILFDHGGALQIGVALLVVFSCYALAKLLKDGWGGWFFWVCLVFFYSRCFWFYYFDCFDIIYFG